MYALRILIAVLVFSLAATAAAEVQATAVKVKGKVGWRLGKTGDWQELKEKQTIAGGTQIRTGESAEAVLDVAGKGVITVHELSHVMIGTLEGDEKGTKIGIGVYFGKLWSRFKRSGDDDSSAMRVDTPAAVASVRGTEFFVESDRESNDARIGVWEGTVAVAARVDTAKTVDVKGGWEIVVLYRKPLTTPAKMEQQRLERQRQFEEQLEQLGAAGAFAPVRGMAEMNQMQVNEAEDTIKSANLIQKGDKQAREDIVKIKVALARLYADTGFLPGRGANAVAARKYLRCLLENDDGRGKEIPDWKGPYIDSDLKDPFGGPYGVYLKNGRFLVINSLGLDHAPGGNDDIEVLYSSKALEKDAEEQKQQQ